MEKKPLNKTVEKLIDTGIPISKAQFHAAVNNSDNIPENYFSIDSAAKNRRVEMWYTPSGLLCYHKEKFFVVPHSNIIYANIKD